MMWLALSGLAEAHDYAIITLGPSASWCEELHALAQPADVVQLLPGTYPGGCDLTLGGLPELNEALLVKAYGGLVTVTADDAGLSLRISGTPTRLLDLDLEGRLEIAADNATIDTCRLAGLTVGAVNRVAVVSSVLPGVDVEVGDTVIRGNVLDTLTVVANSGLVADNTVQTDASSTIPFRRNFVVGDLDTTADTFANVVGGTTVATGRLSGNTLLGPVVAAESWNNLTVEATLPDASGNLRCPECLLDPDTFDVRPAGAALHVVPVESPGDTLDFCSTPRATIGAVGPIPDLEGLRWTAWDRTRDGCVEGVERPVPVPVPVPAPDPIPDPGSGPTFTESPGEVARSRGCAVAPGLGASWLAGFTRRLQRP